MLFPLNATSVSVDVLVVTDAGLPVTGLVAATFPPAKYSLAGPNADATITLSDLALITTAYSSGGVKERGEGRYRLDLPAAVFTAAGKVTVRGEATGKRLLCDTIEVGLPTGIITTLSIADDAITDAKIAVPAETAGRPTRLLAMLRRAWEWSANKRTRDRSTGTVLLRNAADDGTLETQTQSTSGNVDAQTKGA